MCSIYAYTDISFSPEDQATLEAEYKKNPKPDKMARMAIVEQVSLGEKEVQVSWAAMHPRAPPMHTRITLLTLHYNNDPNNFADLVPKPSPKHTPQVPTITST